MTIVFVTVLFVLIFVLIIVLVMMLILIGSSGDTETANVRVVSCRVVSILTTAVTISITETKRKRKGGKER